MPIQCSVIDRDYVPRDPDCRLWAATIDLEEALAAFELMVSQAADQPVTFDMISIDGTRRACLRFSCTQPLTTLMGETGSVAGSGNGFSYHIVVADDDHIDFMEFMVQFLRAAREHTELCSQQVQQYLDDHPGEGV